jgi:hypothetical protein
VTRPEISYSRTGGRQAPAEFEQLRIAADGSLDIWRSVGSPLVGRLDGQLHSDALETVAELARAAAAAGSTDELMPPDASKVVVSVGDDATARFGDGAPPDGPWTPLAEKLRELLDSELDAPIAAIELVIEDDGRSARLVHRGDQPVSLDLSALEVSAVLWMGYYEGMSKWAAEPQQRAGAVVAAPGWSMQLPFDHGLELGTGRTLHASTRFGLAGPDGQIPVEAAVRPAIPYPGNVG